jgi:hypothetical protein
MWQNVCIPKTGDIKMERSIQQIKANIGMCNRLLSDLNANKYAPHRKLKIVLLRWQIQKDKELLGGNE